MLKHVKRTRPVADDLPALAVRVEQWTPEQPSRELADEVLLAFGWHYEPQYQGHAWQSPDRKWKGFHGRPDPLTFLEAAGDLVPTDHAGNLEFGWETNKATIVNLSKPGNSYGFLVTGEGIATGFRSEPRALTAAAIRARAAMEE